MVIRSSETVPYRKKPMDKSAQADYRPESTEGQRNETIPLTFIDDCSLRCAR